MRNGLFIKILNAAIAVALTACGSGSTSAKEPKPARLNPEKTFCQPTIDPNVYTRVDLSDRLAHVSRVRIMQPGEAPIEYEMEKSLDAPWETTDSVFTGNKKPGKVYVTMASINQVPSEKRKKILDEFIYSQKWVGTGISQPKTDKIYLAQIKSSDIYAEQFVACSAFDEALIKPGSRVVSKTDYELYKWQNFAARSPEGQALQQATEPKLPVARYPLNPQELFDKSWCNYQFNANPSRDGGLAVTVYTFLKNRMISSRFNDGEEVSFTGYRYETRFVSGNSVQTKNLKADEKDYKLGGAFYRLRDAAGRDFLTTGSSDKIAYEIPQILPCEDEKVFALHPEWRDWVTKIRAMHLTALNEANDGETDIRAVIPYVDEKGMPQLKVITKDSGK